MFSSTSSSNTSSNDNWNKYKLPFDQWVTKYISVTWRVGKFSNTDRIERWGTSRGETPIYFLYRIVDWVNERLGTVEGSSTGASGFIDNIFFFYDDNYSEWSEDYNEEIYSPIGVMHIYNAYLQSD